jgi:hypothetical protein
MTPEQRTRLSALLPAMRANARRAVSQNEYFRRFNQVEQLEEFMRGEGVILEAAGIWIAIAEKAAKEVTQ